jgi:hypothetical protein
MVSSVLLSWSSSYCIYYMQTLTLGSLLIETVPYSAVRYCNVPPVEELKRSRQHVPFLS